MLEHESPCCRKRCEDVATHTRLNEEDESEELLCCNHFEDDVNLPVLIKLGVIVSVFVMGVFWVFESVVAQVPTDILAVPPIAT